jgi:hypothetical protein
MENIGANQKKLSGLAGHGSKEQAPERVSLSIVDT